MQYGKKKQSGSVLLLACFLVWLIINVRVEAGMGSTLERALDGLVGGAVLLVVIFFALRFFRCMDGACGRKEEDDGKQ